jgi:hypothetical protein
MTKEKFKEIFRKAEVHDKKMSETSLNFIADDYINLKNSYIHNFFIEEMPLRFIDIHSEEELLRDYETYIRKLCEYKNAPYDEVLVSGIEWYYTQPENRGDLFNFPDETTYIIFDNHVIYDFGRFVKDEYYHL